MYTRQQQDQPGAHASAQAVMRRLEDQSEEYTLGWYPGHKDGVIATGRLNVSHKEIWPTPTEELVFQYCRLSERFRYVRSVTIDDSNITVIISGPPQLA